MKVSLLKLVTIGSAWAQRDFTGSNKTEQEVDVSAGQLARRYSDLLAMVYHYNPGFDERKYWAYGCNCLMLGDRPMSEGGKGKPVDELDVTCQHYKQCQKCARMTYGEECIGEMVKYEWAQITGSYDLKCTDKPNTCKRALCECDLDYSKKLKESLKTNKFNNDYHLFWSKIDWNPKRDCVKKGGKSEPKCCGSDDGPKYIFNSLQKQCCPNYTIKPIGMCNNSRRR